DSNGHYGFTNLQFGYYDVSERQDSDWLETRPATNFYFLVIDSVQPVHNFLDFGNTPATATISGMKFHDLNANGIRDSLEPGLPYCYIYIYGTLSGGVITDSSGQFAFRHLPRGSYTVFEYQRSGWEQTAPLPQGSYTITIDTFGQSVSGLMFGNV